MEKTAITDRQHVHGRPSAITDRQHVHDRLCVFEGIWANLILHRMRSSTSTCVYICISVVKDRQHLEARDLG